MTVFSFQKTVHVSPYLFSKDAFILFSNPRIVPQQQFLQAYQSIECSEACVDQTFIILIMNCILFNLERHAWNSPKVKFLT